jgi:hypothetical protein
MGFRNGNILDQCPGYRSRVPGFDSRRYQTFWEVVGLERGRLSLVRITEELLGRNSSGSGLENREYGRGDPLRWTRDTLYPQKLALTSPTSSGRSVGIVRLRTKATEFLFFVYSRKMLSSNIGRNTGQSENVSWFSTFPPHKSRNSAAMRTLPLPSRSLSWRRPHKMTQKWLFCLLLGELKSCLLNHLAVCVFGLQLLNAMWYEDWKPENGARKDGRCSAMAQ